MEPQQVIDKTPIESFARAFGQALSGDVPAYIRDIGTIVDRELELEAELRALKKEKRELKKLLIGFDDVEIPRLREVENELGVVQAMSHVAIHSPLFHITDLEQDSPAWMVEGGVAVHIAKLNQEIAKLPVETQLWLYKSDRSWKSDLITEYALGDKKGRVELFLGNLLTGNPKQISGLGVAKLLDQPPKPIEVSKRILQQAEQFGKDAAELHAILVDARKKAFGQQIGLPTWAKGLSEAYCMFLERLFSKGAKGVGLAHYTLLAVGSLARGEVCPYSDIDFQLVIHPDEFGKGSEIVKRKFDDIVRFCNSMLKFMGEEHLDDMQADIANFKPSELAKKHALTEMDIIQDVIPLCVPEEGSDEFARYRTEIDKIVDDKELRQKAIMPELCRSQGKFHPTRSTFWKNEIKDVKKGLLRLPVFFVRNLIFYYGLKPTKHTIDARCQLLVDAGLMHQTVSDNVQYVAAQALEMRRILHAFYKGECESIVFAEDWDDAPSTDVSVGGKDLKAFKVKASPDKLRVVIDHCVRINVELHKRMDALLEAHTVQVEPDLGIAEEWEKVVAVKKSGKMTLAEAMANIGTNKKGRVKLKNPPKHLRNVVVNVEGIEAGGLGGEVTYHLCSFELLVDEDWVRKDGRIIDGRLFDGDKPVSVTVDDQPKPFATSTTKAPKDTLEGWSPE